MYLLAQEAAASELAMSVITLGELRFGAEKSASRERALTTIHQIESTIQVVPLTEAAGQNYGQLRAALPRQGLPIGNNDLWLAAHARAEGWILVTNNEREFARIDGLQLENWAT
ncbi:MAG: PIN domain-containing protein [Myxococcota bacterium]